MKKGLYLIFFLFCAYFGLAQNNAQPEDPVYADVDVLPTFPGGDDSLRAYLHRNIQYFPEYHYINFKGTVYLSLTVTKSGRVKNPKVLQTCGYEKLDKETLRVLSSMPAWTPAKNNNKPVSCFLYIHVDIYPD